MASSHDALTCMAENLLADVSAAATSAAASAIRVVPAEPDTALFTQFRPVSHFLARRNWMNDPCAPYFDADTGFFHLFYQANPNSSVWGNMTWGHAVSKDQVTWTDRPDALRPYEDQWDNLGVFSGCAVPKAVHGLDTVFYTGVTRLPPLWRNDYNYGEHVVYATTSDHGETWQKGLEPVVELPPEGLNVTGWRDPFVFHSHALDQFYGTTNANYLLVSGGIRGVGPRHFLYSNARDYIYWDFKGFLLAPDKNTTFSATYSGNWGSNFEMSIYLELQDEQGDEHSVVFFGTQGEPNQYSMWAIGSFAEPSDGVLGIFRPSAVGVSDYSNWYANSAYKDPATDHYNIVGWMKEENGFPDIQAQGWNGMLSFQRELSIVTIKNVVDVSGVLDEPGNWVVTSTEATNCGAAPSIKTIQTVGLKPIPNLTLLRGDKTENLSNIQVASGSYVLESTGTSFELSAEIADFTAGSRVGCQVRRSADGSEVTTIEYDDTLQQIIIDRSKSSTTDCAPFTTYKVTPVSTANIAPFQLFHLFDSATCTVKRETLRFRIFVDVSSVEVFVNDRLTLSARIYPCGSQDGSVGIALFSSAIATFKSVEVWTNPKHAFKDSRAVPSAVDPSPAKKQQQH